jgi:hypothetical protein
MNNLCVWEMTLHVASPPLTRFSSDCCIVYEYETKCKVLRTATKRLAGEKA